MPCSVVVIQSAFDVTVNGTMLPVPVADTETVCVDTLCALPAVPVKVRAVGETDSTGFVVTTSDTGSAVTMAPPTETETVVL